MVHSIVFDQAPERPIWRLWRTLDQLFHLQFYFQKTHILYSAFVLVASQKILVNLQENPYKWKQLAEVTWYTSCKIISVLKEKEAIV